MNVQLPPRKHVMIRLSEFLAGLGFKVIVADDRVVSVSMDSHSVFVDVNIRESRDVYAVAGSHSQRLSSSLGSSLAVHVSNGPRVHSVSSVHHSSARVHGRILAAQRVYIYQGSYRRRSSSTSRVEVGVGTSKRLIFCLQVRGTVYSLRS